MKHYGNPKGRMNPSNYQLPHDDECKCLKCDYQRRKKREKGSEEQLIG